MEQEIIKTIEAGLNPEVIQQLSIDDFGDTAKYFIHLKIKDIEFDIFFNSKKKEDLVRWLMQYYPKSEICKDFGIRLPNVRIEKHSKFNSRHITRINLEDFGLSIKEIKAINKEF